MKISVKIVRVVNTQNHAKTYFCAASTKKHGRQPESSCNFVWLFEKTMIYLAATTICIFYGILFYCSIKFQQSGEESTVRVTPN